MSRELNNCIAKSNIAFGTSGARGLVDDFTNDVCAAFAQSFVRVMQRRFIFSRVVVGIDNRPSSPQMAAACCGALRAMGLDVDYFGVLPTPALAYQAMQEKVPAIMVTGSHIPFDRNGLKFYRPDGEISKEDELAILSVFEPLIDFIPHLPEISGVASANYMQRYLQVFPADMLSGKHIGIYEHSSAGRDLYFSLFEALGAKVTRLERTDSFVPIDTEAVSDEDKQKGLNWATHYHFDAIFSTDGDGDRPLISDETGQWLRGDIVGLLCAKALGISALAVPVSCNTAIEKSALFNQVVRTRIGSPYVIAAFEQLGDADSYAGFEANGGFLLGSDVLMANQLLKALPTRDALLPALALLSLAKDQPLSQVVNALPKRYTASDRLQGIATDASKALIEAFATDTSVMLNKLALSEFSVASVDTTDGLRVELNSGDIVHLRPSGNAPELRCYAESTDEAQAANLVVNTLAKIKAILN